MTGRQALLLGTSVVAFILVLAHRSAVAESDGAPIVRIAELEIDPEQLDAYKLALKEEIETSIRVEPGVLTLYSASEDRNMTSQPVTPVRYLYQHEPIWSRSEKALAPGRVVGNGAMMSEIAC